MTTYVKGEKDIPHLLELYRRNLRNLEPWVFMILSLEKLLKVAFLNILETLPVLNLLY